MAHLLSQVLNCSTYNISNHNLKAQTTNLTSNIWSALYNMIPRTKKAQYVMMGDDGYPYVHIPQKYIASCVQCSISTVERAIRKLKDLGMIVVMSIRSHASTRNFYRVPLEIFKKPLPEDPCKTDPDKDAHTLHFEGVHTGNYLLNTEEKNKTSSAPIQTIENTLPIREMTEEEKIAIQGSWTKYFLSKIPPKQDMAFRSSREPSRERTTITTPAMPYQSGVRSVGSILGKIKGICLDQMVKSTSQDPLTVKKRTIDRSTMAGDIKKIHKQLLDKMGTQGLAFIASYIETSKIKIEYNAIQQEHMAIIEDNDTRNYIQMKYGNTFNDLKIKIVG